MDIREKVKIFFEYVFVLTIILNFQSVWLYTVNLGHTLRVNLMVLLIISSIGIIFSDSISKKDFNKSALLCGLFIILLGGYLVFQPHERSEALRVFVPALIIFFVVSIQRNKKALLNIYKRILVLIAIISLFFWVLGSCIHFFKPNTSLISTWTGSSATKVILGYSGLYYETQRINIFGMNLIRNSAIFTEAPMASFAFSIALGIDQLIDSNKGVKSSIILTLAIFSTLSSTGIIYVVLLYICKYFGKNNNAQMIQVIKLMLIPVSVCVVVYFVHEIIIQKMTYSSGILRLDDYVAGYKTWVTAPLFGTGINNVDSIIANLSLWRSNFEGISNSITPLFAEGGLYISSIYIWAFLRGIYLNIKNNNFKGLVFIILYLMSFCVTISTFCYLTFFLLSMISTTMSVDDY